LERVVPQQIGSRHLEYLERAAECRRRADAAITPAARANFLEAESRWLAIADTYAKPEQTADAESHSDKSQIQISEDDRPLLLANHGIFARD
jgi:hypothetical protein